jgi:capsular exopolysaccharide synthesis family protein
VAPKKMLVLGLALIMGLIIPVGWTTLFSANDIIYDLDQIMSNTDIPVITSISYHNSKSKKINTLSLWNLKESFRDLSANLKLISPRIGCTVLGITSIMPEEGKTFCAINLGITLAEAGKRTLIIDTDLRNPSLVDGIQKIKGKGLSDYLDGSVKNLEDIINTHEEVSNLQFIPTSVAGDNFHGLIAGSKITALINNLRQNYDYIILDTPAAGLVSDYLLFRDEIDINLFVVRRKVAKIGFLAELEKLAPSGKKKKNYIIFNDARQKSQKYGYGQKYGVNQEKQLVNDSLSV